MRLEEPERDDNEGMASEDSCGIPERSEALAGRSRHHELRIIVPPKQESREVTNTNAHDKPDAMELQRKVIVVFQTVKSVELFRFHDAQFSYPRRLPARKSCLVIIVPTGCYHILNFSSDALSLLYDRRRS